MPRSGDKPQINISITPELRRIIKGVKHAREFDSDADTIRYLIRTHPDSLALPAIDAADPAPSGTPPS